jgi:hypothetical protein
MRRIYMLQAQDRLITRFERDNIYSAETVRQNVMYRQRTRRRWSVDGPSERDVIQASVFRARENVRNELDCKFDHEREERDGEIQTMVVGLLWRRYLAQQYEEEMWAEYRAWMEDGSDASSGEQESGSDSEYFTDNDDGYEADGEDGFLANDEDSQDENCNSGISEASDDEYGYGERGDKQAGPSISAGPSLAEELAILDLSELDRLLIESWA